jgi:ribosomal protein S18 acetylase RimI-like enzyme
MDVRIDVPSSGDAIDMSRMLAVSWLRSVESVLPCDAARRMSAVWHHPDVLARQMSSPDTSFLVARSAYGILGLVSTVVQPDGSSWISRLYVVPGYQGRGIGTLLLGRAVDLHPCVLRIRLDVELSNTRAVAFYERHGFAGIGQREEWLGGVRVSIITMERRSRFFPGGVNLPVGAASKR